MVDAAGESRYLEAKITLQDESLLREYFVTAALIIEENCARVVDGASYTEDGFIWVLRLDRERWDSERNLYRYIEEAIASYAMMQWLAKKGNERNTMYKAIWDDMLGKCVSVLYRLSAPVKRRRPPYIVPDSIRPEKSGKMNIHEDSMTLENLREVTIDEEMTLENSEEVTIDEGDE